MLLLFRLKSEKVFEYSTAKKIIWLVICSIDYFKADRSGLVHGFAQPVFINIKCSLNIFQLKIWLFICYYYFSVQWSSD